MTGHRLAMLGTGLIGHFYTQTLHGQRARDRVQVVYSRSAERASAFAAEHGIPVATTDLEEAIAHPEADVVPVGLPNQLHEEAIALCARHGKRCSAPGRSRATARKRASSTVEQAGIFAGYLEDLVYTPKTLKAIAAVQAGQIGEVTGAVARDAPRPPQRGSGTPIRPAAARSSTSGATASRSSACSSARRTGRSRLLLGGHARPSHRGRGQRHRAHPVRERRDRPVRGQLDLPRRMDLVDEVAGTEGTIWTNHFLRTGFEVFSTGEGGGYVAEKAETTSGWLFVGDELSELGYVDMFTDMLNALDAGTQPTETFYDGYVVNAVMDACYASAASGRWERVALADWRGGTTARIARERRELDGRTVIKQERMPDGRLKLILKDEQTGEFADVVRDS